MASGDITLDADGNRVLRMDAGVELAGSAACPCCAWADCGKYQGLGATGTNWTVTTGAAALTMGTKVVGGVIVGGCIPNGIAQPVGGVMLYNSGPGWWLLSEILGADTYEVFLRCIPTGGTFDFGSPAAEAIFGGMVDVVLDGPFWIIELQSIPGVGDQSVNFYIKRDGASPVGTYTALGTCSNLATITVTP